VISVDGAVQRAFGEVVSCPDTAVVDGELRRIAADPQAGGLGVALLVAWQQGLATGHVPTDGESLRRLAPSADCPYSFVHVPVRRFRGNHAELARRGILTADPDPTRLDFHEDALLTRSEAPEAALDDAVRAGLLERTTPDDPRIRYTEGSARPSGPVYLPVGRGRADDPRIATALVTRRPCTYCSGAALNPAEATVRATVPGAVRSYRFGFTFAPVGDPRAVCHALGWDAPDDGTPVLDMEPRPFSVGDLVHLVRTINDDIAGFCHRHGVDPPPALTGACNHWAGNSIHHQHYQFFRLDELPLLRASARPRSPSVTDGEVEARRVAWPCPAYLVEGADPDRVTDVAGRVAEAWHRSGPDRTQNLLVTVHGGRTAVIVIPRLRHRVDTSTTTLRDGTTLRKSNAAVLEMAGYFVIDDPAHFEALASLTDRERGRLATSWLDELSPDPSEVTDFEVTEFEVAGFEAAVEDRNWPLSP
jgi:hypothetical protein